MSDLPPFDDMLAGRGCPFCGELPAVNEFWIKIADLSVSSLFLDRNQQHRGYSVMVFNRRHANGLEHLTADEHAAFAADLKKAADAISRTVKPDLMNYASLGNVIPQLHYHLIPRYKAAPRWGAPVWTSKLEEMQKKYLDETEYAALIADIGAALE
jgi:diadenosine tetraphosphate (Ap4A) HIT family hydrolase